MIKTQKNESDINGKAGIYAIKINGKKVYIGKSTDLLQRMASHLSHIYGETEKSQAHKYQILKEASNKGMAIEIDVLYYCPLLDNEEIKEDIGEAEMLFIHHYKPALNIQIPKLENWRSYTNCVEAKTITLDEILK